MIPQPAWQKPYKRGLARLRAGAVSDALRAFDQGPSLLEHVQYAGSASAEARDMLLTLEADISFTVREPLDFDAVAALSCLSLSAQATNLHRRHPSGSQSGHTPALQGRDLTDSLPAEIIALIGRVAVNITGSSDVAFVLSSVCQRWRTIFLKDSRIWSSVKLQGGTEQMGIDKISSSLDRGPLRHLIVDYVRSEPLVDLFAALEGRSSQLRSLIIRSPATLLHPLLKVLHAMPVLETLAMHMPNGTPTRSGSSALLRPHGVPSLVRLEIHRNSDCTNDAPWIRSLGRLLPLLPNLRVCIVHHPSYTVFPGHEAPTVTHTSLLDLSVECFGDYWVSLPSSKVIFPNLRSLRVVDSNADAYVPLLFPALRPSNTRHLTHLIIRNTSLNESTFIGHLPNLAALEHLDIRTTSVSPDFLVALTLRAQDGLGQSGACPVLKTLDVARSVGEVVDRLMEALVASRQDVSLVATGWFGESATRIWTRGGTSEEI